MRLATREEMRRLEAEVREDGHLDDAGMITQAGTNAAEAILAWTARLPAALRQTYMVVAGAGNNGADAWIAARHLHQRGCKVLLFDFSYGRKFSSGAAKALGDLMKEPPFKVVDMGVGMNILHLANNLLPGSVLIDGLIGTGLKGPLKERLAAAIDLLNSPDGQIPTVALDIPSGLDAEEGTGEHVIRADLTLAMGLYKRGYFFGRGPECCGELQTVNFGAASVVLHGANHGGESVDDWAFGPDEAARLLQPRPPRCHKNTLGRALLLAGSAQYNGAPFLAASGALRAGCGVVTLALPQQARRRPGEAALIVKELEGNHLAKEHLDDLEPLLEKADALLFGPGVGQEVPPAFLQKLLSLDKPLVLDADALRLLAANPQLLRKRKTPRPVVLTPHQGEAAALAEAFAPDASKAPPREQALALSHAMGCLVVLKGPRTIVAQPDRDTVSFNASGNPALATAGSGDVLAGVITALAAQMPLDNAARLGVYLHGLAADLYVRTASPRGLLADDLPALIPQAMRECSLW